MAHLIDKDALIAEIERLKADALKKKDQCKRSGLEKIMHQICAYNKVLSFINIFEVKEVNLDEVKIGETQIFIEDDGGEPPYDGKQWLDIGCSEYGIPEDKFKDGDNVEIIIRKIRK